MKIISSILIMLMLFLVGQPVCGSVVGVASQEQCCDALAKGCDAEKVPQEKQTEDCNGCNPFQNCSCCVLAIVLPSLYSSIEETALISFDKEQFQGATHTLFSAEPHGFWQPPRQS